LIEIKVVNTKRLKKLFVDFPYELYKDSAYWVPMFYTDAKKLIAGEGSTVFANGEQEFFLAFKDGKPVGRICVGIEEDLNKRKEYQHAYFTLFESIHDKTVADALIDACLKWAKEKKMRYLKGPVSPTNGDDYRGLLIEGFEELPGMLMPYNPPYYMDFFKDYDCFLEYYAYDYDLTQPIDKNKIEVMKKGIVRSGEYSLEELDGMNQERIAELTCVHFYEAEDYSAEKIYLKTKKQIDEATDSLFKVMSNSYPEDWEEDLMPPKKEEWRDIILEMKKVVTPDLAMFVKYKGEPVGVIAVIPDLTQGIQRAKGKLFPFGWYHLLKSQKETKKARGIILFVDERHQKRGIPGYMILKMRKNLLEAGFKKIEISSISSMNKDSNGIYQWLDMDIVKKYRLFGKSVDGSRLSVEEMYGIASEKVKKYRKTG
jgi:GNAT superfamily N-acetyltransferase